MAADAVKWQQSVRAAQCGHQGSGSEATSPSLGNSKIISFEPRKVGPLAILGPAKNVLGAPYTGTHIASNPAPIKNDKIDSFEYVTWNDDGLGEYCMWSVAKEVAVKNTLPALRFEWITRLIGPIVPDRVWIEKETSPKNFIISMEFSPRGDVVMVIVRRENHEHRAKAANGVGVQTVLAGIRAHGEVNVATTTTNTTPGGEPSVGGETSTPWFQVCDSGERVAGARWTESLFFGSGASPSVLVRGSGIYELVSRNNCALFTNGSDEFINCSNYLQLGRYHRLWMNHQSSIYLITLTPKHNDHIEWQRVFEQRDQSQFSKSLKMIGYSLLDPPKVEASTNSGKNTKANQKKMKDMLAMLALTTNGAMLELQADIDETTHMRMLQIGSLLLKGMSKGELE
eukprot:gene6749-7844_t